MTHPAFPVTVRRSWRRTLTLTVSAAGEILVKAPYFVSRHAIDDFVAQHQEWIRKQVQARKNHRPPVQRYQDGELFLYLGQPYRLTLGDFSHIELRDTALLVPHIVQFRLQKEIETWYQHQARQVIRQEVESYAQRMGVHYVSISFSDTTSKWGSCTHDNKLQFNWRLIMAPLVVVQYLVVHELVHILEKNHSSRFWSKVGAMHPSYKRENKWLKTYGNTLTLAHAPPSA